MKTEIYYFSGTGNSLAVARDLAEKINGKLISVISVISEEIIKTDAEAVGIVFPVYGSKPPKLIEKFVKKIENIGSKYIFAVCTYGMTASKSMTRLEKTIKSSGGILSGGFAVRMPYNGIIGVSIINYQKYQIMNLNWNNKLDKILEYITRKENGKIEKSNLLKYLIFSGILIKMMPLVMKLIKKLIRNGSKSFTFISNEKCKSCGICKKVCPVNNIEMTDNKPHWLNNCTSCFACINWCPNEAIEFGSFKENLKRYHHPDITINDIVGQKEFK
jgi:ferredoxin/flavodoxin